MTVNLGTASTDMSKPLRTGHVHTAGGWLFTRGGGVLPPTPPARWQKHGMQSPAELDTSPA